PGPADPAPRRPPAVPVSAADRRAARRGRLPAVLPSGPVARTRRRSCSGAQPPGGPARAPAAGTAGSRALQPGRPPRPGDARAAPAPGAAAVGARPGRPLPGAAPGSPEEEGRLLRLRLRLHAAHPAGRPGGRRDLRLPVAGRERTDGRDLRPPEPDGPVTPARPRSRPLQPWAGTRTGAITHRSGP